MESIRPDFFSVAQLLYPPPWTVRTWKFLGFPRKRGEGLETLNPKHHEFQGFNMEGNWLVVSTNPIEKYESKWESSPGFGVEIKNIWNHHLGDLLLGPAQTKTNLPTDSNHQEISLCSFLQDGKKLSPHRKNMLLQKYSCKHGIGRYLIFRL